MESNSELTVQMCAIKAKSKLEMYRLLLTDGKVYCPPMKQANYNYIRGVLTGKKKFILLDNLKPLIVPKIDELTVEKIIEFATKHVDLSNYLPESNQGITPNREWLCNIVNTLLNEKFSKFISDKMAEREKQLVSRKNFRVDILPYFESMFKKSKHVSYQKGKSFFAVRSQAKRAKLEEHKGSIEMVDQSIEDQNIMLEAEIVDLKNKLEEYEKSYMESKENQDKLAYLYEIGYIDKNGKPTQH